jgi:dihydrofolate reductase
MRKVVVTEFITLDGVIADPHLWSFPYWTDEIGQFKYNETFASDAQLLGRVTYEGFAAAWPSRDGEFADRFNTMPKYVVSTTLQTADWQNSHIIRDNVAEEINTLKQMPGQDILIAGSQKLVTSLMRDNLIDEYHLLIYPLVRGSGLRLFDEGSEAKLKLVESKTYTSGVVLAIYQPAPGE